METQDIINRLEYSAEHFNARETLRDIRFILEHKMPAPDGHDAITAHHARQMDHIGNVLADLRSWFYGSGGNDQIASK